MQWCLGTGCCGTLRWAKMRDGQQEALQLSAMALAWQEDGSHEEEIRERLAQQDVPYADHRLLYVLPLIREVDPEAHVTLLARNPQACIASLNYVGFSGGFSNGSWQAPNTGREGAMEYWLYYNNTALDVGVDKVELTHLDLGDQYEGRKLSDKGIDPKESSYTRWEAARIMDECMETYATLLRARLNPKPYTHGSYRSHPSD